MQLLQFLALLINYFNIFQPKNHSSQAMIESSILDYLHSNTENCSDTQKNNCINIIAVLRSETDEKIQIEMGNQETLLKLAELIANTSFSAQNAEYLTSILSLVSVIFFLYSTPFSFGF